MNIEVRGNGLYISGYVNVTEKKSRPVVTPHGKVIEVIEPTAFDKVLRHSGNVTLTKDHQPEPLLAQTKDGTLELYEDAIGLHYAATITDAETIAQARRGKIRGMSFSMHHVIDELESSGAGQYPLRRVKDFILDHITLVVNKVPVYAATSAEIRAGAPMEVETRFSSLDNNADPLAAYKRRLAVLDLRGRALSLGDDKG